MASSLAQRLFASLEVTPPDDEVVAAVDARLTSAIAIWDERARGGWPEHVARVLDRRAPTDDLRAAFDRLELDDLALAFAAVQGDREAVAEIERTIIEPLPRALARLRPSTQMIDELRQELREKLLVGTDGKAPKLLDYRASGPLGAWARVLAVRAAHDRQRSSSKAQRMTDEDALAEMVDAADPPDLARLRARYAAELRAAFHAAVRRLEPEQRAVLRSHVVDALTIDQVGALYQVHRATAARWIQQARTSLLALLRDELAAKLGERDACDSVVALVRSQIDLSIDRALRDEGSAG